MHGRSRTFGWRPLGSAVVVLRTHRTQILYEFIRQDEESEAGSGQVETGEESEAGSGLVESEWSQAYVAMGLLHSHDSQTGQPARVYDMELAVCFVKAIHHGVRVPVRDGGISAFEDDQGPRLRGGSKRSLEARHGANACPVCCKRPGVLPASVRAEDKHSQKTAMQG